MNPRVFFFLLLPLFLLFSGAPASAQSAQEIQQSLKERLPEIDSMKIKGLVGENNKGYLEARESLSDEQRKLIEAQNEGRRKLYKIVADRTGVDVETVGVQRARQIRERSPNGIWLQSPEGRWFRK